MRLIISGYGKMGGLIEERADEKGCALAAVVDPRFSGVSKHGAPFFRRLDEIPRTLLDDAVLIDFTHPDAVFDTICAAAERALPLVVGTTGWYHRLGEVSARVAERRAALLYAANFSLGVTLFYKIAEYAASLVDQFDEYDAACFEAHHKHKADSPSGTAKMLAERLIARLRRKNRAVYDKLDRPPEADELHVASLRVGEVPGTHAVYFDSLSDTIELVHRARGREALAAGAVTAAAWLYKRAAEGKSGVFTLEDVLP
jgi:4-hydroxy-tetrahydrodipicolinate reductase